VNGLGKHGRSARQRERDELGDGDADVRQQRGKHGLSSVFGTVSVFSVVPVFGTVPVFSVVPVFGTVPVLGTSRGVGPRH
jgi:hypothetical protein